jgi:hypothetical protein
MVLAKNSIREGPSEGSLGGGSGSGRSGIMLYHFLGNSSIGREIWLMILSPLRIETIIIHA